MFQFSDGQGVLVYCARAPNGHSRRASALDSFLLTAFCYACDLLSAGDVGSSLSAEQQRRR